MSNHDGPINALGTLAARISAAESPHGENPAIRENILNRFYSESSQGPADNASLIYPAGKPTIQGTQADQFWRVFHDENSPTRLDSIALPRVRFSPLKTDNEMRQARLSEHHILIPIPTALAAFLTPFMSVFHELGHYLASRIFGRHARMYYNQVVLTDEESLSYPRQIAFNAAGPAFNFLLGGVLAMIPSALPLSPILAHVLWTYSGLNMLLGTINLSPLNGRLGRLVRRISARARTAKSDGYKIQQAWRAWRRENRKGLSWKQLAAADLRPQVPAQDYTDLDSRIAAIAGRPEDVAAIQEQTHRVVELEARFSGMSAAELRGATTALRKRLTAGESLDRLLPEAFAACREVMARVLGKRPYAEQIAAGVGLHMGRVLQQNTGEGKTLSIGLAAYLNALAGPVDVYTFNPYLALRDADEIGRVLAYLNLKAGILQDEEAYLFSNRTGRQRDAYEGRFARVSRREAYEQADVLYGYNSAYIFDWLSDRDASIRPVQTMERRPKRFAVVDEADAELLEEANTDYRLVSNEADALDTEYRYITGMISTWKEGEDFVVPTHSRKAQLTNKSRAYIEALRKLDPSFEKWRHLEQITCNAIQAQRVLQLNHDYAVIGDQVVILDPHTGRLMWGRHWEAGLHRFVELKEGLSAKSDYNLASHIALDQFMRMYAKVAGITGTIGGSDPEFDRVYGLKALRIPPHRPSVRADLPDRLYATEEAKLEAAVREAVAVRKTGRPVLIGAKDLAESVRIAARLRALGEEFMLLNGVQKESEKDIVAYAGKLGSLTVATQLAGRGTDIQPEPKALELGGLHVVLTQKSSSMRVDLQYRGRTARQGRPGSSVQFISLEDDTIRRSTLPEETTALGEALRTHEDGMEIIDPAVAAILRAIQSRSEDSEAAGRDQLRRKDALLAPLRSLYFSLRASVLRGSGPQPPVRALGVGWRHVHVFEPFGRKQALADLHSGWTDFVAEAEDLWMDKDDKLSETELRELFQVRVIQPFLEGRTLSSRLRDSSRQLSAAVRDFFSNSGFSRFAGWVHKRIVEPSLLRWHRATAKRATKKGRYAQAVAHADRVAALAKDDAEAQFDWAMAQIKIGDNDRAASGFIAALVLSFKKDTGYSSSAERIIGPAIHNLAICLHSRALQRAKANDLLGTAVNIRAAAELDGSDGRDKLWADLRKDLSPEQAALAETTFPFLLNAYLYKGRMAVDEGKYADAERYFSRVLSIDPAITTAHFGRAYARNEQKNNLGAREDLNEP